MCNVKNLGENALARDCPLEHLQVAIGIAEGNDGTPAETMQVLKLR